jgi:hypothetical protein
MKHLPTLVVIVAVFVGAGAGAALAAPAQVPFDRAYTVSSVGSTTPVSDFDLDGPAPVLYLDLPAPMGGSSSAYGNFFLDPSPAAKFNLSGGGLYVSDGEYWLTPAPEVWAAQKAAGDWHVNANYSWWTLVIIYGAGAPLTNAVGSQTVHFTVSPSHATTPINPEPGSLALLSTAASALLIRRRPRTRRAV